MNTLGVLLCVHYNPLVSDSAHTVHRIVKHNLSGWDFI